MLCAQASCELLESKNCLIHSLTPIPSICLAFSNVPSEPMNEEITLRGFSEGTPILGLLSGWTLETTHKRCELETNAFAPLIAFKFQKHPTLHSVLWYQGWLVAYLQFCFVSCAHVLLCQQGEIEGERQHLGKKGIASLFFAPKSITLTVAFRLRSELVLESSFHLFVCFVNFETASKIPVLLTQGSESQPSAILPKLV